MRPRLFFPVVAPCLLLVGACALLDGQETETNPIVHNFSGLSHDSTLLIGTWDWTQTVCCFGNPQLRTPTSTGSTKHLVIEATDSVRVYRNDTLARQETLNAFLNGANWGVDRDSLVVS